MLTFLSEIRILLPEIVWIKLKPD